MDPGSNVRPNSVGIPQSTSAEDDWINAPLQEDVAELSNEYFERWAQTVRKDTHRLIIGEKRRTHPGLFSVLLEDDLIVEMETRCGQFEVLEVSVYLLSLSLSFAPLHMKMEDEAVSPVEDIGKEVRSYGAETLLR